MTTIPLELADTGDIVGFETGGDFGRLIGLGQFLWDRQNPWRSVHHVGVLTKASPHPGVAVVTQAARKVDSAFLDEIGGGCPYTIFRCPPEVDRERVAHQALSLVGDPYGVLTICSIALNILTPRQVPVPSFREDGTFICSALAAYCLHAGGWEHELVASNVYGVMPSQIAEALA